MSEELESALAEVKKGKILPLYMLIGEEFLIRQAADEFVKQLLPDCAPGINYAVLDGASPKEVAQELAILPMFPGRKVVYLRDPEFLAPKKGRTDGLNKAKDAWKSNRRKEGARRVLAFIAKAGWTVQELDPSAPQAPSVEAWKEELGVELAEADLTFLKDVAAYCREEGVTAPEGDDSALMTLFQKGLPLGHTLVVATSDVESKHPLARLAKEKGAWIERKVAAKLKDLDLSDIVATSLGPHQKRLSPGADKVLKERVGGNMRLLQSELEKLALYVEGPVIHEADVELLVHHSREDEFMELSEALQKRDLQAALRFVHDALEQDKVPLALLGAVTGVVRQLLVNFERMQEYCQGRLPRSFNEFKESVYPRIEGETKASKGRPPHPYAVFMGMQAASGFRRQELLQCLSACAEADLALKRGGTELVLERLLWTLCGRIPSWDMGSALGLRE